MTTPPRPDHAAVDAGGDPFGYTWADVCEAITQARIHKTPACILVPVPNGKPFTLLSWTMRCGTTYATEHGTAAVRVVVSA